MTSQFCHNFPTSQAVQGAADATTLNFKSQVNSLSVCGPKVDTLIFYSSSQYYEHFTGLFLQVCQTGLFLKSFVATSVAYFNTIIKLKNLALKSENKYQHIEFDNAWGHY